MDLEADFFEDEEKLSKDPFSPVVVFFLKKCSNKIHICMVRFENDPEWYAFLPAHRPISKHVELCKLIRSTSLNFDENGDAHFRCDLPFPLQCAYINKFGKFSFLRNILSKASDFDIGSILNSKKNNFIPGNSFDKLNLSKMPFSCETPIHKPPEQASSSASKPQEDEIQNNPSDSTNLNHNKNKMDTSTTKNNNQSNDDCPETLENFDPILHDVNEFLERFETRHKDAKNKFLKFSSYQSTIEDRRKVAKACGRMSWDLFKMKFLLENNEKRRKHFQEMATRKFESGDLLDFVQMKFRLFEQDLTGMPEAVQVKLIIYCLPDKYAKKLYINLDDNQSDFIEHLKLIMEFDDDEEDEDEENSGENFDNCESEASENIKKSGKNDGKSSNKTDNVSAQKNSNGDEQIYGTNSQSTSDEHAKSSTSDHRLMENETAKEAMLCLTYPDQNENEASQQSTENSSNGSQPIALKWPMTPPDSDTQSPVTKNHRIKRPINDAMVLCTILLLDSEDEDSVENRKHSNSFPKMYTKKLKFEPK